MTVEMVMVMMVSRLARRARAMDRISLQKFRRTSTIPGEDVLSMRDTAREMSSEGK